MLWIGQREGVPPFDPLAPCVYNIMPMSGLSYEQSGVNYDSLDAFKRACQQAASGTTACLTGHGMKHRGDVDPSYIVVPSLADTLPWFKTKDSSIGMGS